MPQYVYDIVKIFFKQQWYKRNENLILSCDLRHKDRTNCSATAIEVLKDLFFSKRSIYQRTEPKKLIKIEDTLLDNKVDFKITCTTDLIMNNK